MSPAGHIEWLRGAADLALVLEIDRESFAAPWTRAMYEQELEDASHAFIAVLRLPGQPVAAYCSYRLVGGELQINNVAVRCALRRRGLGRELVTFVLRHGADKGAEAAYLEVRPSNEAARRLYAALGFVPAGTRPRYYSNPEEDALVLVRRPLDAAPDPAP
ncbi:MAG TPA: ribosomal protein S18-alanine N-acetyltransferase [Vicinamibacterales bacterium]|nr:ribosomal protein S18-alanine N-acetyltransferase [Vicinamibacterales bacterium]HPW21911.1 ribosomal protein S18-alanine N-acetyltransferase [Vicinamibacterales bacterium]